MNVSAKFSAPKTTPPVKTGHYNGYQIMWILVMFDIPVGTREEAKAASKFREFLLDEGYEMAQFSIYARFCSGKEQFETYTRHIESNLPDKGDIHILGFTDKQYANIIRFSGQSRKRQRKNPGQLALF